MNASKLDEETFEAGGSAESSAGRLGSRTGACDWIGQDKYTHQEDSHWVSPDGVVAVVADGIGGNGTGEVASFITTEVFRELYQAFPRDDTADNVRQWLQYVLLQANDAVREARAAGVFVSSRGQRVDAAADMGSTVVAAARAGNTMLIGWAGDSRGYRLRDGQLEQLTIDHEILDEGAWKLYQYMGRSNIRLGELGCDIRPGDRFLIATDGLQDMSEEKVCQVLNRPSTPEEASQDLIAAVREDYRHSGRKGQDNVTVVVLDPEIEGAAKPEAASAVVPDPERQGAVTPKAASAVVASAAQEPAEAQVLEGAEAPVDSLPLAALDAIIGTIDKTGILRKADLKKMITLNGRYIGKQALTDSLRELQKLGLIEMHGADYKPTARFHESTKTLAAAVQR